MLPPHEVFPFYGFEVGGRLFSASGGGAADLAALGQGSFTPIYVRYAFPRADNYEPFFPVMTADDLGGIYREFDALDWLAESGLRFPRSDVIGLRPDGAKDQLFVKELDLAASAKVFVTAASAEFPGRPLAAAVQVVADSEYAIAPGGDFPARLSAFIPTFQMHARAVGPRALKLLHAALRRPESIRLGHLDSYLNAAGA